MGDQISTFSESRHTNGITVTNTRKFRVDVGRRLEILMMNAIVKMILITTSMTIMSDFNEGRPFIGILTKRKPITEICVPEDPDLILWSMKERLIYWRGKVYCKTEVECSSGSDIGITWNFKTQRIRLCVKPAIGEVQTDDILTDELEFDRFWPVFGAMGVGKTTPVQFELLETTMEPRESTDTVRFVSAGGKVSVSKDGRQIYRSNKNNGNCVAVINRVLARGKHTWKLAVISDFGASIGIGLATYNFQLSERYRSDPLKHVYHHQGLYLWRSYRGHLYANGRQLPHSLEPLGWQNGTSVIVELTLDMREGTLEIAKNGRDLGVAFRDIRGPVQPAVALYAGYEKEIHLIEFQSSDMGSGVDVVESDRALVKKIHGSDKVVFDPNSMKGKLELSEDGLTLTRRREHSGNAYCLLDITLLSGFHRWSFVIQNDQGASTCLGVAREPITLNKTGNLYLSQDLYVFRSFQGILYEEGREVKKGLSEFWLSGSLVEVSFEAQPRGAVVRFSVNGEDQGIAFSGLIPPLRPIIGFYAGMEKKVTLVHHEYIPLENSSSTILKNPTSTIKIDANKVNTDKTNHSSKHHPLPLFLSSSSLTSYYSTCMVCGNQVNVVALPCKHSYMCAEHLEVGQNCLICDEPVTGIWNIILLM